MPTELTAADRLLDEPMFFDPFRPFLGPAFGRSSIPTETYLRLMFLQDRYRYSSKTRCAEGSDSLGWLRFSRIQLGERAPHPSTPMEFTRRCGSPTVGALSGPKPL